MTQPDENGQRAWHFRQLRRSLQALAMTAVDQLTLFPDLAVKADELAFTFDHWADLVRDTYGGDLSPAQADALAAIDEKLATMSRDQIEFDAELWTEAALHSSADWEDVRKLAASALEAFAWPITKPTSPGSFPAPIS